MEGTLNLKPFPCPVHTNDRIQRVSLDLEQPSPLFCIECILLAQSSEPQTSVITLSSFVQKACEHYKSNRTPRPIADSAPNDLVEFLSKEKEVIEHLSRHIESEKAKVTESVEKVVEVIRELLVQKRAQIHQTLDLQLLNLKANYAYYRGKVQSMFGSTTEQHSSQDDIIKKINSLETTQDLEVYVKLVREEMASLKGGREDFVNRLKTFSQQLIQQSKTLPASSIGDPAKAGELFETFREQVTSLIEKHLSGFSNTIPKILLPASSGSGSQGLMEQLVNSQDNQSKQKVLKELVKVTESKTGVQYVINALNKSTEALASLVQSAGISAQELEQVIFILQAILQVPDALQIPGFISPEMMTIFINGLDSTNEKVIWKAIDSLSIILRSGLNSEEFDMFEYFCCHSGMEKVEMLQENASEEIYKKVIDFLEYDYEMY